MADVSQADLEAEIAKILKNADLAETSTKKVIQKLEKVFDCNLKDKKKMIDQLVMDYVNTLKSDEEEDEEDEEEAEEVKKETKKPSKPKRKAEKEDDDDEGDEDEEEKAPPPKKKRGKKKGGDSDDEWVKKSGPKKGKGGRKGSGYTKAYKLSPQLAELMGKDEMPRHEVVKQVWAIIKEKNLYDPSNRQFAICDDALYKVIGTKKFRTFGMMKYLKTHFLDD